MASSIGLGCGLVPWLSSKAIGSCRRPSAAHREPTQANNAREVKMSGRNLIPEAMVQHRASAILVATGVGMPRSNPELRNMGGLLATIERAHNG